MKRKVNPILIFLAACIGIFCLFPGRQAAAQQSIGLPELGSPQGEWLQAGSGNLTLYYQPGINLKRVERALRRRYFITDLQGRYKDPSYDTVERISFRLEAILARVKEILGMYPRISSLKIRIYKNREDLNLEYERIFGLTARHKSFYIHKLETVYTSEQDISDSVMAHEFGHVVIDHYFAVIPPQKVAELIATYVDTHLED